MGNLLNKIVENNVLFVSVIVALCVILVVLILLIIRAIRSNKKINIYEEELEDEDIKKVKNVKKEDIIETPDMDVLDDEEEIESEKEVSDNTEILEETLEEIEEKYSKEKEQEIKEIKEENHSDEIAELLSRMEADSKLKPEDVVANFEKEQEAQSIISYKELVNVVKNRQEEYYEDELESLPLTTVSNYMKQKNDLEQNEAMYSKEEEIEELTLEEENTSTFKNTDVISPVFGIVSSTPNQTKKIDSKIEENKTVDKTIDLRDIDLSDKDFIDVKTDSPSNNDSLKELDEIYKKMAEDLFKNNEELAETTSLDELTRNEEFLQSLKDFRKKL